MTTTQDSLSYAPVRRQSLAVCVLAGAGVVVGWVLYRHYLFPHVTDLLVRWDAVTTRFWLFYLTQTALLFVPYALVLLLWGLDRGRGVAGAVVALATGAYLWGLGEVFANYVWESGHEGATSVRIFEWANLLVPAALVPLAWGLARRTGRGWVTGVLVGPVVAAVLRELDQRWSWWHDRVSALGPSYHWPYAAVVFVVPLVLAALACWALEVRGRRTPDMGSSASSEYVQSRRSRD
jgi:hypothetical protein